MRPRCIEPDDLRTAIFPVADNQDLFAEIKLKKLGVITGRLLDQNRVGIQGVRVIAYPAKLPLRAAAEGRTDERGAFRIFGLEAGHYWVRSAAHQLDDGTGLVPTFFPHGKESPDARALPVAPDRETTDADFRPVE